jgi:hypothetical protein
VSNFILFFESCYSLSFSLCCCCVKKTLWNNDDDDGSFWPKLGARVRVNIDPVGRKT